MELTYVSESNGSQLRPRDAWTARVREPPPTRLICWGVDGRAYDRRVSEPEVTPDGRYIVVDGRRWRATDPAIPEERRAELTRILMGWRRDVRRTRGTDEEAETRAGVQAAKVALGERGTPWWEQSDDERRARWSAEVPTPPDR